MPPVSAQQGLLERPAARTGELLVEVHDGVRAIARHKVLSHAIIGRAADAQIHLDRGTVSRQHAEVLCDPFGRWWIRDLGSRNGVVFSGRRVNERAIRTGDQYQVGDFALRFKLPETPDEDGTREKSDHTTFVPVSDHDAAIDISTARDLGSPKIAAEHLSMLLETGRLMMETDESDARLTQLLQLMLRPEYKGTCSMALRVHPGRLESPVALVPAQTLSGHGGNRVPVSRSLLKSVMERRAPAMAGSANGMPVHGDMVEMSMISSTRPLCAIACPLRQPGGSDAPPDGAMDLLYIVFPPECATGEWLAIAALATEQFRLSESAWAARRDALSHAAVERDLEQARQIQIQFLPRGLSVPGLEVAVGFQPCRWVAGDYTDAMLLGDGRIFLAVADVCGKGLAAALVASSLHTLVRAMLDDGDSLERVMNRLNRHLVRYLRDGRFATMACAIVNPATGAIQYANCGHPPVFIFGPDGSARDLPTGSNLPLGVDPDAVQLHEDQLNPGEMLAMYTDGLSEARTTTGEMLGIDGVRTQFCHIYAACRGHTVTEACNRVITWMDTVSGGRLQDDDRTYLLARRK
ncbi:SpoIIE family protein phosphatase [Humisphaera borealis]|uniref:SpoIIE family protein phosphatase n=1 Tax=Humisphaera borealis TaxID=2807512 RepID=A0A7M2WZV8_9BACT|nr:SpoIIE family protein phosphatase [Humisphaera borealis]QOV91047.1 SpoIIE family protein phosphatase [Humisphaera borealis]